MSNLTVHGTVPVACLSCSSSLIHKVVAEDVTELGSPLLSSILFFVVNSTQLGITLQLKAGLSNASKFIRCGVWCKCISMHRCSLFEYPSLRALYHSS